MATLTIHRGAQRLKVDFTSAQKLSALLDKAGQSLAKPCGGRGVCGKCTVWLNGESVLACQTVVDGDADVILPENREIMQIAQGSGKALALHSPMQGRCGMAIDIGTTTLAARLYDLQSGQCTAASSMLNPQASVAADVIGRIGEALNGGAESLRQSIEAAIHTLLRMGDQPPESLVITGNTTMLYLLTGQNPECLSHSPFAADCLFGTESVLFDKPAYLPPCLHAFVGADTSCALLASGMLEKDETALLCDIGTNGEIALWHKGQLYIASTAAGPAFEGAGISCGCGSIPGAIDRVDADGGRLTVHTIAEETPVGLCGSGLVDAVAALLELEAIDETGAMDEDEYAIAPHVVLTQKDVRAVQLAKAAIAAGTASLLHAAGCCAQDVTKVYIAGGFGSHLRIEKAAAIGLILPELSGRVQVIGNAALDGAALLLGDVSLRKRLDELASVAQHVRLDGNAYFSQRYVEEMLFMP